MGGAGATRTCCAKLGLSKQPLAESGRGREVSEAKALAVWLIWQLPELSVKGLASRLGRVTPVFGAPPRG